MARSIRRGGAIWGAVAAVMVGLAAASPSLTVNQTTATDSSWVRITWSGVSNTSRSDCVLALFAPPDADTSVSSGSGSTYGDMLATAVAPLKMITCDHADDTGKFASTGAGAADVRLINVRQNVGFKLFSGGKHQPVLLASSPPIAFDNLDIPMHVHIARTGNPAEMLVAWTSRTADDGPTVRWGTKSGVYDHQVMASHSETYGRDDMCGAPANLQGFFEPGFFHRAVIGGLTPSSGATVFYSVGNNKTGVWSAEHTFVTPQMPQATADTRIHIAADVGATAPDGWHTQWSDPFGNSEKTANETLAHLSDEPTADAVLHPGDIAYGVGWLAKWELFMHQVESIAAHVPYMTGMGNHERDWPGTGTVGGEDSGGECGTPTQARFTMPVPSHKQEDGFYSVDIGNVHAVMMFTEVPCGSGSMQYDFLAADLASVNRTVTPWVIFLGHRPMYSCSSSGCGGPDHSDNFCRGGADVEPLLVNNSVDLVLWGHVHNAVATCPMINGACAPAPDPNGDGYAAPVHVIIGNGGQSLSGVPPAAKTPAWVTYASNEWGWATLETHGAEELVFSFRDDSADSVRYNFTLTRKFPRAS